MPCSARLGCSINSIVSGVTDPSGSYFTCLLCITLAILILKPIQSDMSTKFFSKHKYYYLRYNQDLGIELQTLLLHLFSSQIFGIVFKHEKQCFTSTHPQWFSFLGPNKSLMLQIKCNPWLSYKDQHVLFAIMNFSILVLHLNSKSEDFTTVSL